MSNHSSKQTSLYINNSKIILTIFALTTGLFWFSLYAYVSELSTYADTLGASYKMIGLITGSYGFTQLILRIPIGIFSDTIGKRKPFILFGLFITFIGSILPFLWPTISSLLIARLFAGISAATWVLFTVLFSSYFHSSQSTKSIGIINSYSATGQLLAMAIGGSVSWLFGTQYLFLLSAMAGFIGLILAFFITEVNQIQKKISLSDFKLVITNQKLLSVSFLAILSQFITFATTFGFVPILAKNFKAVNIQLSLLTSLSVFPAIIISRYANDLFPRKIGKSKTLIIGFFLSSILCIIFPWIKNLNSLYIAQFIGGIGRSMVFPLLMGIGIEEIKNDLRATAMGFFQASYGIGMVLGPILLGFVSDNYGLTIGFTFTGLIGLCGIIIVKIITFK